MPMQEERRDLYSHYLKNVPHAADIDCSALSMMSQGMSPADVANVVNRAAARAARDDGAYRHR